MVTIPSVYQNYFFLGKGSIGRAHMSWGTLQCEMVSVALTAAVSLVSIPQTVDLARVSIAARHYFNIYLNQRSVLGFDSVCSPGPEWVDNVLVSVKHKLI